MSLRKYRGARNIESPIGVSSHTQKLMGGRGIRYIKDRKLLRNVAIKKQTDELVSGKHRLQSRLVCTLMRRVQ